MQNNLFYNNQNLIDQKPLADRMRPRNFDEFFGQEHILAKGRVLRRAIERDALTSSIFYGPAGSGKTTVANIIASNTKRNFVSINAVSTGVAELRNILKEAEQNLLIHNKATYLFLDECHRWTKSQSDSILPAIENGIVIFIGSTTENPSAAMTPAIVSRCRVYKFNSQNEETIKKALYNALNDKSRGYGMQDISIDDKSIDYIAASSGGDFRQALSALEFAVITADEIDGKKIIDINLVKECVQTPRLSIDKQRYYDMISAFIKSMRGSDSNAALFWLAALLHSGIDPKIIARRVMVHASEDVGMANPIAMLQAHAAVKAVEFVGMPEARIPLAQAVIAICESEKSNRVCVAIDRAMADARAGKSIDVPNYLKDHSYSYKGEIKGEYLYPHDYEHSVVEQNYLPSQFINSSYYEPSNEGYEKEIIRLRKLRNEYKKSNNKNL